MLRSLLATMIIMVYPIAVGSASTLIQDPGEPDLVTIGTAAIEPGGTAVISITITNDEDVDYINIPVGYDNTAFQYVSCEFVGQLLSFDDKSAIDRPGESMVTIFGWSNLVDPPNPYLNTNGNPEVMAMLTFQALPDAPINTYPLLMSEDPLNGPILFGHPNGEDDWTPTYRDGFIQILEGEEGYADSVRVMSSSAEVGQQVTVGIVVCNDEDVSHFTIPIEFDASNFSLAGYQLYGDIYAWDDITVEQTPGTEFVTIVGQAAEGDQLLNTGGISEIAIDLYFSSNPAAPPGNYGFNISIDPIYGGLIFRNPGGEEWIPFSRNAIVTLNLPPTCDMKFNYLWAYGFCQSPSINRQYSCRITNYGADAAENVVLAIAHPAIFTYRSSSPEADVNGNVMTWNLGSIIPGGSRVVNWFVDIPEGLGNDTIMTIADITSSTNELEPADNHREFVEIVGYSYDPNDKAMDPMGYGVSHHIGVNNALMFTVYFENSDSATLPATDILIIDTLDANIDNSIFEIGPMSHPDPCSVWFDIATNVVTCFCDDIMLPPNVNPPEGEGFFTFSVFPKWNLRTGDMISNRAQIRFDLNPWMEAPLDGPVFVTMDVTRPVSRVLPLPEAVFNVSAIDLFWEGNDGLGSGVAYYDIYASRDGEPFELWMERTIGLSAVYPVELDHAYAFYSRATDNLGFTENAPQYPDAIIIVGSGCDYSTGDINGNGATNGIDVVYGVNYLKGGAVPPVDCSPNCPNQAPPFFAAADVNGNCVFNGIDITYFVNYLKGGQALRSCPDCPPAGR